MIRPEIEELERLGPLPADDDDYPGIDRKLFDVEHLLAAVDPPVTVEEGRVLAALFPRDGGHLLRPGVVVAAPHRDPGRRRRPQGGRARSRFRAMARDVRAAPGERRGPAPAAG